MMLIEELDRLRQQSARRAGLSGEVAGLVEEARERYVHEPAYGSLAIVSRIRGFLRHIITGVIRTNFPDARISCREGWDEDIYRDFVVMASRLGIVRVDDRTGAAWLEPQYRELVLTGTERSGQATEDEANYGFMLEVGELGSTDDSPEWLRGDDVGYFPIMVRYFREIENMTFTHRVPISLGTPFCSDLGEMAFLKFTSPTFDRLLADLAPTRFLDVGCGEGHHVAAAARAVQVERSLGIEMDPEVAESARCRLDGLPAAEVIAGDVRKHPNDEQFDVVFACYMLFYMDREQQTEVLRAVRELLAPGGVFVLCQYFPDFADFQQVMIENDEGAAPVRQYTGAVVNSCIDAEVLLNQTLSHFRSGIFWHEYRELLEKVGFTVTEVRPADPLYYSHYVLARRSDS